MSIVAITDTSKSALGLDELQQLAARLNVEIIKPEDADDYLKILQSFESVVRSIDEADEYIPPELSPRLTTTPRQFWKPNSLNNPFNAWSHRCNIQSATPTNSLLAGRTIAIKDNISVGSLPTTVGLPESSFADAASYPTSSIDATVVSRILDAGAVIKGTSTCESYCASPLSFTSATGPVHNPRLRGYTAGGSSSGSAVLVAAHYLSSTRGGEWGDTAELAIGSDQAGSVRVPASFNGLYGLKPTFGLIPYTGAGSMSTMIDHLGPIAGDLEGIVLLLETMAGYDEFDPRMTPESPLRDSVKPYVLMLNQFRRSGSMAIRGKRLRVGLLKESFSMPGVTDSVRDMIIKKSTRYFEAVGASMVDISVPIHVEGPAIWTATTRTSMSSSLCQGNPLGNLAYQPPHLQMNWPPGQEAYDSLTALNPAVVNIMLSELFAQAHAKPGLAAKAHRQAFKLRAAYDSALEKVDVLIAPCTPSVAMHHPKSHFEAGETVRILKRLEPAIGLTSNTCPFNVTGHPALSVPCGELADPHSPHTLLPVGMQIIGKRWADEKVIEAAALFEMGRAVVGGDLQTL